MPKVGGRRKKARSHAQQDPQEQRLQPKTFIFKRGKCPQEVKQLALDLRRCWYPNTALKLQDAKKMSVKSYLKAAKYYNVNHLIALQHVGNHKDEGKEFIRFIKVNGGEMSFRILNFAPMKSVLQHGGQPFSYSFKDVLLVLDGFNENQQTRMIGRGLQELFPPLNLEKQKTENFKRVISFSYRSKKKTIFFRQYKITQQDAGISSNFKKLMDKPKDLSSYHSLKEYIEANSVKNSTQAKENQQKLNLFEIGPRMKLKFVSFKESSGHIDEPQQEENGNLNGDQETQQEKLASSQNKLTAKAQKKREHKNQNFDNNSDKSELLEQRIQQESADQVEEIEEEIDLEEDIQEDE